CWEYALLHLFSTDGRPVPEATFGREYNACMPAEVAWEEYAAAVCDDWESCLWRVPVEFTFGEPGSVTWRVPRELMLGYDVGTTIFDPQFRIMASDDATSGGNGIGYRAGSPPAGMEGYFGTSLHYPVDVSDAGARFELTLPEPAPSSPGDGPFTWSDPAGDGPAGAPQIDLLAVTIDETPSRFIIEETWAELPETPAAGTGTYLAWAGPSRRVNWMVAWYSEEGTWGSSAVFGVYGPGPWYVVRFPIEVESLPGTPGTLRIILDRGDLDPVRRGDLLHSPDWIEIWPGGPDGAIPDSFDTPAAGGYVGPLGEEDSGADFTNMPPYRARFDTDPAVYEARSLVYDDAGDVALPQLAATANPDQFDISYLAARGGDGDVLEFSMGVRDLSDLSVPPLYRAVFYGLGARTDAGDAMVGYYREENDPAGQFFCAPDVTVLPDSDAERQNPTASIWTMIDGRIELGSAGDDGARPGTITFEVPASCFAPEARDGIRLERLSAGTFLVQNPSGSLGEGTVHRADDVAAEGPVELPFEVGSAEPIAPAAWYVEPFGVSQFWGLSSIALLATVGLAAGSLKIRERRRDARAVAEAKIREDRETYRQTLERAIAAGTDAGADPVLAALRRRLGISEREHAILELSARGAVGISTAGLATGTKFLGRYRIEKPLGEGGFARTFLARDETLVRRVVLKIARWDTPEETK
ncbi:MAG: hypothetical protein ACT4PT_10070, partial [Methanobacteriota archaeon]